MLYSTFKQSVLAYVNRHTQVFNTPGVDLVLEAMNDVRRAAQREYTFNLNRIPAFVEVSMVGKSMLTDFRTAPSGSTVLIVKQIDGLYNYETGLVGATTVYKRSSIIRFNAVNQMKRELPNNFELSNMQVNYPSTCPNPDFCYLQGIKLYHASSTTPTWIMADVVEFMDNHTGDTTEDIFLTFFADWLKWSTIMQLNQYLAKDQRFSIDAATVGRLWESVKQYDAQQAVSTGSIDLD